MKVDYVRWAEANFVYDDTGPAPGENFRIASALFLRDVFDGFGDPSVREGACRCSAQSGKTQTGVILAAGAMEQDPGPFMWVLPAKDEVETFAQTRLMESFERIRRLSYRLPKGRSGKKKTEIAFPGAPLILVGAHSGSKLSGKPIRYLFLDEEKDYPAVAAPKAIKRVRAKWNAKIWRMSTPREAGQNIDAAFLAGDQRHYHIHCPNCGDIGPMVWENLRWDDCDREDDLFNSIRYECPNACGKKWYDNPTDRADLIGDGNRWVAHNTNAPRSRRSWTWNAMLPDWNRWWELVSEYRGAVAAKRLGNDGPMEIFETETLGKPLKPKDDSDPVTLFKGDYKKADYELGQLIEGEKCRGMFIDRQLGHYWAVIRAFRKGGGSRLLWEGRIDNTSKIEDYRQRYKVVPACTFMDARFQPQVVYALCARMGYTAMLGSAETHWRHPSRVQGQKGPLLPYSTLETIYVGNTSCWRLTFSNLGVKDVLANLRAGKGAPWEIPADTSPDYDKQIDSEVKRITESKVTKEKSERWVPRSKGFPNHLWDCYGEGVEVLTSQGWKEIADVGDEEVATFNLETETIEYQKPTAKICRRYQGEMVHVNGRGCDLLVTPGHRMVVHEKRHGKDGFLYPLCIKSASSLCVWDTLRTRGKWNGATEDIWLPESGKYQGRFISRRTAAAFVGWYVTEGHLTVSPKDGARLGFSQNRGQKQEILKEVLREIGWTSPLGAPRQFISPNNQLCAFAAECGRGVNGKRVPQWLKDSAPEIIQCFLDSAILGDGWKQGKMRVICTVSKQLADDYCELVVKSGGRAVIKYVKAKPYFIRGHSGTNTRNQYWVQICSSERIHLRNSRNEANFNKVPYEGFVHCLMVPNGTLVVRSNGGTLICGNCEVEATAFALSQRLLDGSAIVAPDPPPDVDPADVAIMASN